MSTVQALQKNRGKYQAANHRQSCRQLCEHAEVSADGAENRRRCTSTAERQKQLEFPPKRTVQNAEEESYSIFDWDS